LPDEIQSILGEVNSELFTPQKVLDIYKKSVAITAQLDNDAKLNNNESNNPSKKRKGDDDIDNHDGPDLKRMKSN
jgi:hypothetical protein